MVDDTEIDFTRGEDSPWYAIQSREIVTVEHPCLVKNVDAGIQTLGGFSEVDQMVKERGKNPISLFLNPRDPASRPLISTNRLTSNVLLKITVPKRTGRKRKRGSSDPWIDDALLDPPRKDTKYLLQSLRDNPENSTVEIPGSIVAAQLFRTMPDFVYSTSDSAFMTQIREKILPFRYPFIKEWKLDTSRGKTDGEIVPPPTLSTQQVPGNYGYRQNPAVQAAVDKNTGKRVMVNAQKGQPTYTIQVHSDTQAMPIASDPSAPPLSAQDDDFRRMVSTLQGIFSKRPIWTRRGMLNQLPAGAPEFIFRRAIGYVAYALRSGPWRDCYVKLGVDPTTNPEYRIYQSITLQFMTKSREMRSRWTRVPHKSGGRSEQNSHIFHGGLPVHDDGKAWQLCDFTDPLLARLAQTPNFRSSCERRYFGWYKNGTYSKIKIIFKAKMDMLLIGEQPDDSTFESIVKFPEEYHGNDYEDPMVHLPPDAGRLELLWASQYRAMCRAAEGTLPASGRLTKSRPNRRVGYLGPGEETYIEEEASEAEASAPLDKSRVISFTPLQGVGNEDDEDGEDDLDDLAADGDGEEDEWENAGDDFGNGKDDPKHSETDDLGEELEDSSEEAGE